MTQQFNGVLRTWAAHRPGRQRQGCTVAWAPACTPAWALGGTPPSARFGISAQEPLEKKINFKAEQIYQIHKLK